MGLSGMTGMSVDMEVTVNICLVAPDVSDSRTVVAVVGLDHTVRRREEAPMYCDGECAELGYSQRV